MPAIFSRARRRSLILAGGAAVVGGTAQAAGGHVGHVAAMHGGATHGGMVTVGDPERMGGSSSALGAFKAALHLRGVIDCPATAEPQVPLSPEEVERVGKFLAGAGLL